MVFIVARGCPGLAQHFALVPDINIQDKCLKIKNKIKIRRETYFLFPIGSSAALWLVDILENFSLKKYWFWSDIPTCTLMVHGELLGT